VVEVTGARRFEYVAAGVIRTPSSNPVDQRLLGIWQGLAEWLDEHQPDVVCVERVFAQHNLHSVMGTAQAAGLAITAAAARGIPVAWHTPSEIKAAVTGSGRAQKPQVQTMVQKLLGLAAPPEPPDAADALALAITHILRPTSVEANPVVRLRRDPASPLRSAQDDGWGRTAQDDGWGRSALQNKSPASLKTCGTGTSYACELG